MKPIKVGLLGLGTVGTGVVRIVENHQDDLKNQIGSAIEIEKIVVSNVNKARNISVAASKLTDDAWEVIRHPEIDVIIEVMGGTTATKEYIVEALKLGKHVVTANKDLMALYGGELLEIAQQHGSDIYYEASVAGGIPILRTLVDGFSSDRITKIMGIVNGTTNYILTKMTQEGASYADVLKEAQQLGYAEADPTSDVEGLDAARKMVILARLGFHTSVDLQDVSVQGISNVTKEDIQYAKRLGYQLKLLGIAQCDENQISVSVQPTMVKNSHPIASVNGVFNAVLVTGEAVGETMFYGAGAGELPTATSVVADLVAVSKNMKLGISGKRINSAFKQTVLKTDDQISSKYFLLLEVADRAGVLAQITQELAKYEISLESVLQQANPSSNTAEIIVITHDASKAAIQSLLDRFKGMDVIHQVKSVYRVEG
ncbi:homoserine dehydrogenase [Paenibacillus montaniterrae]|uniref:Homoserine dehydrogenase n=1 Tax=Paenibacillus montaniterrae TaxID=429341 RepID=A0A919YN19_9BACL|nr:homoserine dehydrogenase [Paenibacillus montaniterrae]GIP16903.1 homoserine dehydrogenase [Paenibacillus montaniterrae]